MAVVSSVARVPIYKLYGEREQWPTPDMVHCESIADRSKLHDWKIKPHQHHGLAQILYLRGGHARVCLDSQYFDMRPGHIVIVPQMCVHGFRFAPNAVGHVVTLAYPLMDRLVQEIGDSRVTPSVPCIYHVGDSDDAAKLEMAFGSLHAEYVGNGAHRGRLMESMLVAILIWLSRHDAYASSGPARERDRGHQYFHHFCRLIEKDYAAQYSVDHYAKRIGITAAYLNVLCRQYVDQSALELIHQRVVLAAKRNLVYTSMTISVVSYMLGFSDPAYFTRFFKRQVGFSPKEFRRQAAKLLE